MEINCKSNNKIILKIYIIENIKLQIFGIGILASRVRCPPKEN